jgi:glycine cleavage system H lipoate-binding protein
MKSLPKGVWVMVAIMVVFTIVLFIAADLLVQWVRARQARPAMASRVSGTSTADLLVPSLQSERFALPAGLFFHRGHTWANLLFSGQVKVGVDDFVQKLLGHIDAITLPPLGVEVKQGQPFVAIRQGGRTATLPAPVDGVVCAVNGELARTPGLLRRDPYTRGWLVALQPINLAGNLPRLTVGESALVWLKGELARLQEFLHVSLTLKQDALVGATAADGGLVADSLLEHLDDETWADFQSKFLAA